jgi:ATP-binding cassette subfamily F protein 3
MLTVSQLSKSFAGRALFDDVSLQVNRGGRVGLVGANGAGKSTLFALLLGDVSPDKERSRSRRTQRSAFFRKKPPLNSL